jgi:hypothetical protein
MKEEKYQEVVQQATSILEKDEFDPEIIEYLFAAQKRLDQAEYVQTLTNYLAIMEGIQATGTGKSYDEAWIVISPSHEYDIMSYIGEQSTMQSLQRNGGHDYDVLSTALQGDQKMDFYFNIDKPFRSLSKTFSTTEWQEKKKEQGEVKIILWRRSFLSSAEKVARAKRPMPSISQRHSIRWASVYY